MPHLIAAAITGATLALMPSAPAPAADTAHPTTLRLTLTYTGDHVSATRTVTLHCDPAGGTHPDAEHACADLDESEGRFARAADGRACTAVYAPVTARAVGSWHGRPARFRGRFGNDCAMHARTGAIFAF